MNLSEEQKWALKVARTYLDLSLFQFLRKVRELGSEEPEKLAGLMHQHSGEMLEWLVKNLIEDVN